MNSVYLDYNATTPVDPDVVQAMQPYFAECFANPSSIHSPGQRARNAVERSRVEVARSIHADPKEIFFTGSGTEGNNTALKGILKGMMTARGGHVVTTPIEHSSIGKVLKFERTRGVEVTEVKVDSNGRVDPAEVERCLRDDTVLVTIGHANNEIGTIQPISDIAALVRKRGIKLHADAVQSLGKVPLDVNELGVDLLTLSAHKAYGPKGVGALYVREGVVLEPILHGGGQEGRLRSGTENVPYIVGFGRAASLAASRVSVDAPRHRELCSRLADGIRARIPGSRFYGDPVHCLPQTINVGFDDVDGLTLQIRLDLLGFAVSTGSACSSGSRELSHVHAALGAGTGATAIRVSLGRPTTGADCAAFLDALEDSVVALRAG